MIEANYFKLIKTPDWSIHNYFVEFSPAVESKQSRKTLLYEHRNILGGYLFDGQTLFLTKKLPQATTHLQSVTPAGDDIKIQVKYTSIIPLTLNTSIQVLNMVLRRAMDTLQLQGVGKNFFDAASRVSLKFYSNKTSFIDNIDSRSTFWTINFNYGQVITPAYVSMSRTS